MAKFLIFGVEKKQVILKRMLRYLRTKTLIQPKGPLNTTKTRNSEATLFGFPLFGFPLFGFPHKLNC